MLRNMSASLYRFARDGKLKTLKTTAAERDVVLFAELGSLLRRHKAALPLLEGERARVHEHDGRAVQLPERADEGLRRRDHEGEARH